MAKKKPDQQQQQRSEQAAIPVMRQCQASGCQAEIESPRYFCDSHWSIIPSDVQMALFDALVAGSKDFVSQVLRKAIALITEHERQQSGAS